MINKFISWLKPTIWIVILGVVSNTIYWFLTIYVNNIKFDYKVGIYVFMISFLFIFTFYFINQFLLIRRLGVVKIYDKAEETTKKGLQEASESYWWLGTSAYYVLCSPSTRDQYIETKRKTDFLFITVDSECPIALTEQARWQRHNVEEVAARIAETKRVISRLRNNGCNITWEGHSSLPTFRIVIINKKKVLVSFYEHDKLGPECKQLSLNANGLLGQWFIQFFNKSRILAKRMRIARKFTTILCEKTNINKNQILSELISYFPDDNPTFIEETVNDLTNGVQFE